LPHGPTLQNNNPPKFIGELGKNFKKEARIRKKISQTIPKRIKRIFEDY